MKTLLQTLFFLLLVTQICSAQWYQQTGGTTLNLNSVSFYDSNNGMIVGDSGIILGTTNGGINWIVLPPNGNNNNLYSVHYKSGNWTAVGSEGTIIRNGNLQTSGTTNWLLGVWFTDTNNGWAVGDDQTNPAELILRTTNGGTIWTQQSSGTTYCWLTGVCFTDSNNGWAVGRLHLGGGVIFRTTNGGTTWASQVSLGLNGISFTDSNTGWTVGDWESIWKTTNGGIDWILQYSGNQWLGLGSVSFTDVNKGTAVGDFGKILRTTNGGTNWIGQNSGTTNGLSSVFFIDSLNGWAVGVSGTILHTTNGGVSFVEEQEIDEIPTEFLLSQNYPNPFNPSTKIKYSVPQSSQVQIKVFDVLGNEIETLVNEEKPVGTFELNWYAENLPSGVYFYQLKAGSFIETKKMVLIR